MSSAPARPSESASQSCPVCRAPGASARCEECGAALAPGGYRVERLISQSPRGRLYLALDEAGVKVAVKELVFASVPSVEEINAFEREAKTLAQLDHPRIPRLVRYFEEGRGVNLRFYLVQTFIEGQSLLQSLEKQRYSEKDALRVARQVLDILGYLHGLSPRVLHRDLKPANLIQQGDALYLVDFDCARDLAKGVTHQATLVGTFGYCPPEQLGGTASPSSDLYALGATLVHLLSRKAPADLLGPGMRLKFEDAVNVSQSTRAFLGRLLDVDPAQRFQSAEEARKALDSPAPLPKKQEKAQPPPPPPAAEPRPAKADPTPWLALGGVVVVLALTLLVTLGSQHREPAPSRPRQVSAPQPPPPPPPRGLARTEPVPVVLPTPPTPPPEPVAQGGMVPVHDGASAPLDHEYRVAGLQLSARSVAANPEGRRAPGKPVWVHVRFQARLPKSDTPPLSYQRMALYGVDHQWPQYATLLASRSGCVRCQTLQPLKAMARLEDGSQVEMTPNRVLALMDHREKLTVDSVMELDLVFEVRADQFPFSIRFHDGRLQQLPWTY